MTHTVLLIIFTLQIFIFGCSSRKNQSENNNLDKPKMEKGSQPRPESMSTIFTTPETVVLQILPDVRIGKTTVNGKEAYRTSAHVFIPNPNNPGSTISCPENYFQQNVSLPEKWILNDSGQKITISNAHRLNKVVVTKKVNGKEEIIDLPDKYPQRLMNYFNLDISHNEKEYKGFDCYAFASLVSNVKYYPLKPDFEYQDKLPSQGDIVVLSNGKNLPESIMHWAIFLGDNQYLSKFGRTGEGASSLLTIMDLEGMKKLYDCNLSFVAIPKQEAKSWEGYKP